MEVVEPGKIELIQRRHPLRRLDHEQHVAVSDGNAVQALIVGAHHVPTIRNQHACDTFLFRTTSVAGLVFKHHPASPLRRTSGRLRGASASDSIAGNSAMLAPAAIAEPNKSRREIE